MSGAVHLSDSALYMMEHGIVSSSIPIKLNSQYAHLARIADKFTFRSLASLLLSTSPPSWLSTAVRNGVVHREYIPFKDLDAIIWLEPFLDDLLITASSNLTKSSPDLVRESLGLAGELVMMSTLTSHDLNAVHVSRFSDTYGYDIELLGSPSYRVEVKSATTSTRGSFHLSRNEFDKSKHYGSEWQLVQVVFDTSVFQTTELVAAQVLTIRSLDSSYLESVAARDSPHFRWTESCVICVDEDAWREFPLHPPDELRLPSLKSLSLMLPPPTLRRT